ncbi:MAG: Cys-Gln thioester bond-forming surface protein, partial [Oscillospiraceae bacterium]|nr:Cys-Gln thioester bond-forming surface protein [Oscillospiraceae bacterium]
CIDPDNGGIKEGVEKLGIGNKIMTYYRGEKVGNATYISILNEGYPHNRLASLHLNTLEEGYYATKMALWMYILGATEADIGINPAYGSSDPAAKRVYDAAISIFKYGVSKASEGIQEPEIIITADRTYPIPDSSEQYRQQIITINANKYVGTNPDANGFFKLAWADPAAVPAGTKIELPDGTDITSAMQVQAGASSISQIVVKYPIDATEFTTQLTVNALLQGNDIYTAYYTGDEGDANMQRYLVEADPKKEISANFTATLSVEDEPPPGDDEPPPEVPGTLRVVKLETGTLIPLAGAVFDIKDPDGVTLYSMATDASGTISIPVSKEGYYTITERVAPRFHTLPTHTTQGVQVRSGETAIVTFEDSPYGSLTVYKRDAADGRNLSGAVIQIKNIATSVIQTATTDSSGSVTFDKLPCAANGTGYEVRELTAPQGYALDNTVHARAVPRVHAAAALDYGARDCRADAVRADGGLCAAWRGRRQPDAIRQGVAQMAAAQENINVQGGDELC